MPPEDFIFQRDMSMCVDPYVCVQECGILCVCVCVCVCVDPCECVHMSVDPCVSVCA